MQGSIRKQGIKAASIWFDHPKKESQTEEKT